MAHFFLLPLCADFSTNFLASIRPGFIAALGLERIRSKFEGVVRHHAHLVHFWRVESGLINSVALRLDSLH